MSLVAAALEREGIATVCIQFLADIASRLRPPRALVVPFRHGYPLDRAGDPDRQLAVMEAALRLLEQPGPPPVLATFPPPPAG